MSLESTRPALAGPRLLRHARVLLAGLLLAGSASAQDVARLQQSRLAQAAFDVDAVDRVAWDAERAVPQFLAGDLGRAADAPTFFRANAALFAFKDDPELAVLESRTDDLGLTHVRVQQTVRGVPVWGATSALHVDRAGRAYAWGGDLFAEAEAVETTPALGAAASIDAAIADLGAVQLRSDVKPDLLAPEGIDWSPRTRLVVYPHDDVFTLAYHVRVFVDAPRPANWEVFVDAKTGEVLHRYNSIHTFDPRLDEATAAASGWPGVPYAREAASAMVMAGPTTGTGTSTFGGTLTLPTYLSGSSYYLYDTTRGPSYIRTMTANNGTSLPGSYITDADNNFSSSSQKAGVDAHFGAISTYDYYKNTHGRNSYNGSNATITSTVHYASNYNNAFWNGAQMVYGDGDGTTFIPLVALDIAAHELTHAVTEYTAGLIYEKEPGALNEAVSDIMAVMVDRNDYLIGEDSYTPGISGDALRNLANPAAEGQPDHYDDRLYPGSCSPTQYNDYCGVHSNSGIVNKAAYLMIAGGTFHSVTVSGIGRNATEKIWYRALATYFSSTTNFSGARQGTIQAATDLYGAGSSQVTAVTNAWAAVGVGSTSGGGGGTGGGTPEWHYETATYQTPHNYPNNYTVTHTYSKPGATSVALYFEQFNTEANYDFVYIKDENGTTQATYHGSKAAFWAIVDGATISSTLVSDYSVTRYGYRITQVAYYSDQTLIAAGEATGQPLGYVPQALASDVIDPLASLLKVEVSELALAVGPNPARGATTAVVDLPEAGDVRVAVVDMLGREVAVAFAGALEAGRQSVAIGADALPAGVYVVVLDAGGQRLTRSLTVVR